MIGANRFFRVSGAVAALVAISMTAGSAHADDKVVCANASENGQKLRDDGKLMKARQEFLVCSRDVCPQVIKKDCVDWLQKSEENLPTVVLGAKDSHGQDVMTAHVTCDGAPLADKLDGKAVFVDPGLHTFRFEIPGEKPIEQQMVLHEGEKNRLVSVSPPPAVVTPPPGAGNPVTPPPPEPERKKSKVPAIIVGGLGVATVAAGGVFYFLALGNYNDLKDGCGKTRTCTSDDTSPVQTKADVSYVLLGVGGALVITGVVLYVLESGSSSATVTTGKARSKKPFGAIEKFGVAPLPGGAAAVFGASF